MNSQEVIILFVAIILAASLVIFTLYGQVREATGKAEDVSTEVSRETLTDFEIVNVNPSSSESNIYIRGVSGELNVYDTVVVVDGVPYTPAVRMLRDERTPGILDPDDLALLRIPTDIGTADCVMLDVDGTTGVWGIC